MWQNILYGRRQVALTLSPSLVHPEETESVVWLFVKDHDNQYNSTIFTHERNVNVWEL